MFKTYRNVLPSIIDASHSMVLSQVKFEPNPAFVWPEFSKRTMAASQASNAWPPARRIWVALWQASLQTRSYRVSSTLLPAPIRNNWKYKNIFQGTTIQFLPVWTAIKPDISENTKLLITVPLKPALCFFLSWSLCVYPSGMAERFEWVGVSCIFEKSPNPLERLYYTQHMLYMLFVWNAFNSRAAMNAKIKNTSQAASCKIKICYICI